MMSHHYIEKWSIPYIADALSSDRKDIKLYVADFNHGLQGVIMAQSEQFGMSYFLWPVSHVPIFHHTGTLIRNLECATPVAAANASTPYIHS